MMSATLRMSRSVACSVGVPDWDMLRANLLQLLVDGTVRPHEPAYDPEPDAYVTWDYCRGYADASLNEATSEPDGYR